MSSLSLVNPHLPHAWLVLGRVVWWLLVSMVAVDPLPDELVQLVHWTMKPSHVSI